MAAASSSFVRTDRAARYGKQLVSHLSRRHGGHWADSGDAGWIDLGDGRLELSTAPDGLALSLTTETGDLDRLEDVVGRHLVRFGARAELRVRWAREDGEPGTTQQNDD